MQNDWSGLAEDSKSSVLCQQAAWRETLVGWGKETRKIAFCGRISFLGLIIVIWSDPTPAGQQIVTIRSADGVILTCTVRKRGSRRRPYVTVKLLQFCISQYRILMFMKFLKDFFFYEMCWVSPVQLIHSHVHENLVFPRKYCKPLPMAIRLSGGKKNCSRARHEGILVRGCVAPLILTLSVRQRRVFSLTLKIALPPREAFTTPVCGG